MLLQIRSNGRTVRIKIDTKDLESILLMLCVGCLEFREIIRKRLSIRGPEDNQQNFALILGGRQILARNRFSRQLQLVSSQRQSSQGSLSFHSAFCPRIVLCESFVPRFRI